MKSKIVIAVFIAILLSLSSAFSQDQVYELGYMYTGSDTLDYTCGGTERIAITISKITYDNKNKNILFTGKMTDLNEYLPIDSSFGKIFLGKIENVIANTWIGNIETGILKIQKQFKPNEKGEFSITVPVDTKSKFIFTGFGCNVKEYSIKDLINLYNK
jgi:hypothetical protein